MSSAMLKAKKTAYCVLPKPTSCDVRCMRACVSDLVKSGDFRKALSDFGEL